MRQLSCLLILTAMAMLIMGTANANYTVAGINTTVLLSNHNTSAQVIDVIKIYVSNNSVAQYTQDRLSLNLSLSQWQVIFGPVLVEHILSPRGGVSNFNFLPGPLLYTFNGRAAYLSLKYTAANVTTVSQTAPRTFQYSFNNNVFNFGSAASGAVLGQNTTLTIIMPTGAKIISVYPLPDYPALGFTQNYRNTSQLSWYQDEPLSRFTLTYTLQESLQSEVLSFFTEIYTYFGWFLFLFIGVVIVVAVYYIYMKVGVAEK